MTKQKPKTIHYFKSDWQEQGQTACSHLEYAVKQAFKSIY